MTTPLTALCSLSLARPLSDNERSGNAWTCCLHKFGSWGMMQTNMVRSRMGEYTGKMTNNIRGHVKRENE